MGQQITQLNPAVQGVSNTINDISKNVKKANDAINNSGIVDAPKKAGNELNNLGNNAKKTGSFIEAIFNSISIGLSHSVGAIAVGANVIRSLVSELTRNIAIGAFNFVFRDAITGLGKTNEELEKTAKTAKEVGEVALTVGQDLGKTQTKADEFSSSLSNFLATINLRLLALSAGAILLGKVFDALGDKLITFTKELATVAGEANLAFTQLGAVLDETGQAVGESLGSTEEWMQFVREVSIQSGRSQKDLAEFAVSFVQVGANAGLTGEELQKLLRIAAFTGDRFRTSAEQLNNFRNALTGNFRPINTNIFLATDQDDAIRRLTESFVRQGKTQEEAETIVNRLSTAQRGLLLLQQASVPIIETATKTTGNFALETRKLQGAFENLRISFGTGVEGIFARFTKIIRDFIQTITSIPKPIQDIIGQFVLLSGVVLEVGGKLLKLAGIIGLVSVAVIALNKNLLVTLPLIGVSFGQIFGRAVTLLTGVSTATATLGGVFAALGGVLTGFLIKFAAIGAIVGVVISVYNKLDEKFDITTFIIETLVGIIEVMAEAHRNFFKDLTIGTKVIQFFNELIALLAASVTAVASVFNAGAFAVTLFAKAVLQALSFILQYVPGSAKAIKELEERIKSLDGLAKVLAINLASTTQATVEFAREAYNSATNVKDLAKAFDTLTKSVDDFTKANNKKEFKFNEEQDKIVIEALEAARKQFQDARVDLAKESLGSAKAAEQKFNDLIADTLSKLKKAGVVDEQSQEFLQFIQSLKGASDATENLRNELDSLKEHKKIFQGILQESRQLEENFRKQSRAIAETGEIEQQTLAILRDSTLDFDKRIEKAEKERAIREATAKLDKEISDLRAKLTDPVPIDGKLVFPKLTPAEIKQIQDNINKAEAIKATLVIQVNKNQVDKELREFITELGKDLEGLQKRLVDNSNISEQQLQNAREYNRNLDIGVEFADQQLAIKEKELEIDREIQQIQIKIAGSRLSGSDLLQAEERIRELQNTRDQILKTALDKDIQDRANKVKQSIIQTNQALSDQLRLLSARKELFTEGILIGEFNEVEEKINLLTNSLTELISKRIELDNLRKQGLIDDPAKLDILNNKIVQLKESLKALSFVQTIQRVFSGIGDAINDAITDGVRGVIQGTQTIQDLFRKMASDIFLSISRISAQFAIDRIKNQVNQLILDFAKSDIAKKIAGFFGIDLTKLDFTTPEVKFERSVDKFAVAVDKFAGGPTTTNTGNIFPGGAIGETDITGQLGKLVDFENVAQQIRDGTAQLEVVSDAEFSEAFQGITGQIQFGLENISQISDTGLSSFFDDFGSLIKEGLNGLTELFSSEGGGGFLEIFSGIAKGIGAFFSFGAAKGTIVPGAPSDKDNTIARVASGEAITNARAVQYYGKGLFNSLNNMELPQDFLTGLQNPMTNLKSPTYTPIGNSSGQSSSSPVDVTIINKQPLLDPSKLGMQEKDVIAVFVNGVRKDREIRRVIREDIGNS